jgi:transcriptional regulator GlxA family with amidase domain
MANNKRPLICLLAAAESSPAVLYGLYDILSSVGVAYPDMTTGVHGDELLDIRIVADTKAPFRCVGNVLIEPHASIDDIGKTDVIIVSDLYTPIDTSPRGLYPREVEWMQKMYANNAILTSVCVGSAVLAETGLLDGLEAASHWAYRHMFKKYYPQIKWREDSILNLTAKQKRIVTAGGATSWQDLALYLIAQFCGVEHAIYTAKIFLLSCHTDGQLPFSAMTQYHRHDDAVISGCQTWITENYACANPVASMADRSGLQARTFARRFRAATGYQPLNYVQDLRIEAAKNMLETGSTAVDDVSAAVGYEDPSSFRRLFKRKAGLTPAIYRKKFAAITQGLPH